MTAQPTDEEIHAMAVKLRVRLGPICSESAADFLDAWLAERQAARDGEPIARVMVGFGLEWAGPHYGLSVKPGDLLYAHPSIAQPVKVPDLRADAIGWGNALNEAAWVFTDECPEKSALLFNHTKAPLRLAILKYLELVSTSPSQPRRAVNAPFGNADHIPPIEGVEFMHFDNLSHPPQLSAVADEVVDRACEDAQVSVPDEWREALQGLVDLAHEAGFPCQRAELLLSASPAQPSDAASFQSRVGDWMRRCFERSLYGQMIERGDRLAEEVIELLQAHHYPRERLATLIEYVYNRPIGEPEQEVGGVMITLSGFCHVAGHDMMACGERELARINTPEVMAKIRAKQKAKNALHFDTPLPGAAGMEHAP